MGAWHTSWNWNLVKERLEELGHTVLNPDLPGHGDDPASLKDLNLESSFNHHLSLNFIWNGFTFTLEIDCKCVIKTLSIIVLFPLLKQVVFHKK
jgi:hypothetical protein